jgi:hypothetical protein
MMDSEHILLALLGAGTSFITFCLMRFPRARRPQFQPYGPFSFAASFFGAMAIFFINTLVVYAHGIWG